MTVPVQNKQEIAAVNRMLKHAEIDCENLTISLLYGGNNRVYKIDSNGKKYILKNYFPSGSENRSRLISEFSFLKYGWECGVRTISKPVFYLPEENFGVFEFIDGRKLEKNEVSQKYVKAAADFIVALNSREHRASKTALSLPSASDAWMTFQQNFESIDKRVNRLLEIETDTDIHKKAVRFINSRLIPEWQKHKKKIKDISWIEKEDIGHSIISPSDFGFHNAIIDQNNTLFFIDFEYAGWDHSVKMICDFFCQPETPVPMKYLNYFIDEMNPVMHSSVSQKVTELLPLFRVKWCCIILNDFLRKEAERRNFAYEIENRQEKQLVKAAAYAKEHFDR